MLVAAAGILWPSIDGVPFYTKGEPREAIVVQQMVAGEGLALPLLGRGEIQSKPPLFHWMGAAIGVAAGGVSETGVRAPSLLAGLLVIALVVAAGYRHFGTGAGVAAGVTLLTCLQFVQSATAARVDMVLAAAIAVSLLAFLAAYADGRATIPLAFYLGSAAAVLTKGPVGYALPLAVVASFLAVRGDLGYLRERGRTAGLLLLALPLLWYAVAWLEGGQAFIDKLILKENLYRIVDPDRVGAGHVEPAYYYVPALIGGFAPWSLLLPWVAADAWKRRRLDDGGVRSFLVAWFAVTFIAFSMAGSKRPVYLLSCYPSMALLIGAWLARVAGPPHHCFHLPPRSALWAAHLLAVVLAVLAALVAMQAAGVPTFASISPLLNPKDAMNLTALAGAVAERRAVVGLWVVTVAITVVVLITATRRARPDVAIAAVAFVVAATTATVGATFLRDMAARATIKPFMLEVRERVPAGEPLYFYGRLKYLEYLGPAAEYYAGRSIGRASAVDAVTGNAAGSGRVWFLAGGSSLSDLQERPSARHGRDIARRSRVVVRHDYPGSPGREPLMLVVADDRPRVK